MKKTALLRVETGRYVAGSVWWKVGNEWWCVSSAPILWWMTGKTPQEVHKSLLEMGAKWQWITGGS